jgi:hypothetical protein
MIKSISTQTGDYSYSLNLQFTGYEPFEFGFSGQSKIFSFTGVSGKIYDQDSNYFYSYEKNESLQISGNKIGSRNNYFVNNVPLNSNNSQNTGHTESFFVNGPVSTQFSFRGNHPNYRVASGKFLNGSQTGLIYVYNDGSENFKFYSGNFIGPSGEIFGFQYPFDSGNIESAKQFTGTSLLFQGGTGKYPVIAEFYTNFGLITQNFYIHSVYELETLLFLNGPSFANTSGNYNYTLDYDLFLGENKSTDPYNIFFEFRNESGRGDFTSFTGDGTGYYTGTNYDFQVSSLIVESGQPTGLIDFTITGENPYLGFPYTGRASYVYTGDFIYATGEFDYTYSIASTGLATGHIMNNVNVPINDFLEPVAIGFTGELDFGWHPVTGTGILNLTGISYYEGQSWEPSFEYTGIVTGEVFSSGTTGIISTTGFVSGDALLTGVSNFSYEYDYIGICSTSSGYYEQDFIINTDDQGVYAPTGNVAFTGDFFHKIQSKYFEDFSFEFSEQGFKISSGVIPFYGNYYGSGTGAFFGNLEINGYTGLGIGGFDGNYSFFVETNKNNIIPSERPILEYSNVTGENISMFPLTGFKSGEPLEISGNSGIMILPVSNGETYQAPDFPGYENNPTWVRYDNQNYTGNTSFFVSPLFYASGDQIYKYNANHRVRLSFFSGDSYIGNSYNLLASNWNRDNSTDIINDFETIQPISEFDNNQGKWDIQFSFENELPSSGFMFVSWKKNAPLNPDTDYYKVFGDSLSTESSLSGAIFSDYLKAPTGQFNGGVAYRYNGDGTLIYRPFFSGNRNSIDVNFTSTGSGQAFLEVDGKIRGSGDLKTIADFASYLSNTGYRDYPSYSRIQVYDSSLFNFVYSTGLYIEDFLYSGTSPETYPAELNLWNNSTGALYEDLKDLGYDFSSTGSNSFLISGKKNQFINFGISQSVGTYYSQPSGTSSVDGRTIFECEWIDTNPYYSGNSYYIDTISGVYSISESNFSEFEYTQKNTGIKTGEGSFYDTAFTGEVETTGFVSGQWIETEDISGYWDIIRSGDYGVVSALFTGEVEATGLATGIESFTINSGSGRFNLIGEVTGTPISVKSPILQNGIDTNPFTGYLDHLFIGSGNYSELVSIDFTNSGFFLDLPTYVKTFSGEYNFYTGTSTGDLVEINYDSANNIWSGVNTVTGENSFIMQVQKTKNIFNDSLYLFYSGENNTTGGFEITS